MRLSSFLDRVPFNILILDDQQRVLRINRLMAEWIRPSAEGYGGKTLDELFPTIAPLLQPSVERALCGETVRVEMDVPPPIHVGLTAQWSVTCFPFGKSEVGVVISEISERRRMEEAFQETRRQLEAAMADIERNALANEMAHFLQASNTSEELYNIVSSFGARLFPENSGALCVIDSSKNMIEVKASWGDGTACELVFALDTCWALREGRPHLAHDSSAELVCGHVSGSAGSHLCIPMMAQSEMLGILYNHKPSPLSGYGQFPPAELRLIHRSTEEIGLALANLRLRETLQHQALRDPLTGLYNRRFFYEALNRELRRAVRKKTSIGVIMLDVDHFKLFNDSHGHAAGDTLLRAVSALLQARVRAADVLCRLGGDEFSILMPEATLEHTILRAEELRQAFKLLNFEWRGRTLHTVTSSMGAAAFPTHGTTAETLLHEADTGLYLAKSAGRDRVITNIPPASSAAAAG